MTEPIVTEQTSALFAEFSRSGLRELHIRSGEIEIYLSHDPSSASRGEVTAPSHTVPAATAPQPPASPRTTQASAVPPDAVLVLAPNLGTFYGAPKPGAAAYVSVGSTVTVGAEICLIEVMKLFTAVRAEFGGRIAAILASDGEMVEAGQPLFAIVKD